MPRPFPLPCARSTVHGDTGGSADTASTFAKRVVQDARAGKGCSQEQHATRPSDALWPQQTTMATPPHRGRAMPPRAVKKTETVEAAGDVDEGGELVVAAAGGFRGGHFEALLGHQS
jgi:hypothetical protein